MAQQTPDSTAVAALSSVPLGVDLCIGVLMACVSSDGYRNSTPFVIHVAFVSRYVLSSNWIVRHTFRQNGNMSPI